MAVLPQPILDLIESFARLPGIGPKSASRLALHLLRQPEEELGRFGEQIKTLQSKLTSCKICQNIASQSPCDICRDTSRATGLVCIVEDPLDVVALEKSGHFRGRYHVLHGVLSPIDGIGPEQIKLREFEQRVAVEKFTEVVLATNPTIEGEATALYIRRRLEKTPDVRVTRLAHGLPVGADLEYADEVTLARALDGRQVFETSR